MYMYNLVYIHVHVHCIINISFLVENDSQWIADKSSLVEYLKKIWNSNAYHAQMAQVLPVHM